MDILLVEPDTILRGEFASALERTGLSVRAVGSAADARQLCSSGSFDVVVLDVDHVSIESLEQSPGRRLRGCRTLVVVGFEPTIDRAVRAGADGALRKPFGAADLVAFARRHRDALGDVLEIGDLRLDARSRTVTVRGAQISLARLEFDLLWHLAVHAGRVFTNDELLEAVWKAPADTHRHATVKEHIRRIRTKIERDPQHPERIVTVSRTGYRLDPSPLESDVPSAAAGAAIAPTAIAVVVGTTIRYANAAARALLASGRDISGRDVFEFVSADSDATVRRRHTVVAEGGWPRPERVILIDDENTEHAVDMASTPVVFDGEPASQVAMWPIEEGR
jgi:DNA-binding response OmpR family regulator